MGLFSQSMDALPLLDYRNVRMCLLAFAMLAMSFPICAAFDACLDYFPAKQIPQTSELGRDLCFDGFAVYYSPQNKKPIYTVEKLNRDRLKGPHPKRSNEFYEEARLPFKERSLLLDYRGSGLDRGHNAPAGDMSTVNSMAQSFSLANMMPQAKENNRGIWAKSVEAPTRQYAMRARGDVFVYTGSTGSLGTIGRNHVVIPAHLFKLVYDAEQKRAWAYWIENTDRAPMRPPSSYEALVKLTGIDFHLLTTSP